MARNESFTAAADDAAIPARVVFGRAARIVAGFVLLLGFILSFREDWGYITFDTGEFRAVKRGGSWYAFDPGEHPEIDGFRFDGEPPPLPARASFHERLDRPVKRTRVPETLILVYGRITVEHSPLQFSKHWAVPWVITSEPSVKLDGVEVPPDGAPKRIPVTDRDLSPALPAIAVYLGEHYPGTGLRAQAQSGLGVRHTIDVPQLPVLAFQAVLLGGSLLLWVPLIRRWRRRARVAAPQRPHQEEAGEQG